MNKIIENKLRYLFFYNKIVSLFHKKIHNCLLCKKNASK